MMECRYNNCSIYAFATDCKIYAEVKEAKEIIKDLLSLCKGETDSKLVFTSAEAFIGKR